MQQLAKLALGLVGPMPGILERLDLRLARPSLRQLEKQVVIALRIKRRVEIDQIHRLIRDLLPQHLQVIPVVEPVHCRGVVRL
ncbi:MAG TPA: hypothetical protein VGG02_08590 [Chthoniobacterales bacterium]